MAGSKRSLTFPIFGKDVSASKTMKKVAGAAERVGKSMQRVGIGLAIAGVAAFKFGSDAVKAFSEAEESQNKLAFAFTKFPKLADTNQKALQKLNTALQKKTRFDDDAIAVGQATLAQYKLTGAQIKKLTPLLLDYAGKTGKDVSTAATDLGKALLGQGRALKVVGIEFKDAGSVGANFDQLMQGLSSTVGGFAEKDATTAAGKLDLLKNRFGEVQEKIGGALLPALVELMDLFESDVMPGLEDFSTWFAGDGIKAVKGFLAEFVKLAKDGSLIPSILSGYLLVTAAQWGLNAAMTANPVGAVIAGVTALIALGVAVAGNWNTISKFVYSTTGGVMKGIAGVAGVAVKAISGVINYLVDAWNRVLGIVNPIREMLGMGKIQVLANFNIDKNVDAYLKGLNAVLDNGAKNGVDGLNGSRGSRGAGNSTVRGFATGGIVRASPGGTRGVIGEAGNDEAVIPLSRQALSKYGLGGGGDTYVIQVPGGFVGSENQLAQAIERVIVNAKKRGAIKSGVFA